MKSRRRILTLAALAPVALAGLLLSHRSGWARYEGRFAPQPVDLSRPDVLVRTRSLRALPKDLLRVPIARDLLTEEAAFYYEDHPDRLSLSGSLRRIAYEHDLRWSDEIVSWALDEPAELALFSGPAGSLDTWVLATARPEVAAIAQELASVVPKDSHVKVAGSLASDGDEVPVYALDYGSRRTLLVASAHKRVAVLSEPGLLLDEGRGVRGDAASVVGRLLSATPSAQGVFREALSLTEDAPSDHTVAVSLRWLSFGYGRFFPALEALRFDFGGEGWTTRALVDPSSSAPASFRDRDLWSSVPPNPALCLLLPVDWTLGPNLGTGVPPEVSRAIATLSGGLDGPVAACWYGDGSLQAPLFAATAKEGQPALGPALTSLFDWGVRRPKGERHARPKALPGGAFLWARELEVPFASLDEGGRPAPGPMKVTLATAGRHVYFSPDERAVQKALETAAGRRPSLGETLQEGGTTLGVLVPSELGAIARREALVMLPPGDEPVFRKAAERNLLPRLEALGRHPAYRLALPSLPESRGWQVVRWQELSR
jgi:uncharacterized protein YfaA (DUF2138 family)